MSFMLRMENTIITWVTVKEDVTFMGMFLIRQWAPLLRLIMEMQ